MRASMRALMLSGVILGVILSGALACSSATPVGTKRISPEAVQRELGASVLSTGRLSASSLQLLERFGLRDGVGEDRLGALQTLLAAFRDEQDEDVLYALAEISYLEAERRGDPRQYLAAAVYAYALLFPGPEPASRLAPWDPRLRTAFDVYNRALAEGLLWKEGRQALREGGSVELPPGELRTEWHSESLQWNGFPLKDLVPAAHLEVRGLRNRYRRAGLGAPLIATLGEHSALSGFEQRHVPPRLKVPITALLRIEDPRVAIARGRIQGRIETYSPDDVEQVSIDGSAVPLEVETTSALAHTLEGAPVWNLELSGFFGGDRELRSRGPRSGLLMIHPYRPGRIPLVLVHGTASSPARWAELVNEIDNDERLASKYQIWLFLYDSGNPIGYSAGLFCADLREAVSALDPEGRDPALRQMVLLGHSQGGLLVKLAVVSSGHRFWQRISDEPLESLDLSAPTKEELRRSLYFEPLAFVKRVIFLATPQRGSYLASWSFTRLISDLIAFPNDITQVVLDLGTLGRRDSALIHRLDRLPTSLDNMTPGNPFIQTLASLPVDPSVVAHSIIAVKRSGPLARQSDGVVRYESAHIDGVESEKIVRSSHSAQGHPDTINEVRRILLEHLRAFSSERATHAGALSSRAVAD